MSVRTESELLFDAFCRTHSIPCTPVATGPRRTPDFQITLLATEITCEVKQIDLNADDRRELTELRRIGGGGRFVPNRLRGKLKNVSPQLKQACVDGHPTLLVVYDNTPFKAYSDHMDVIEAMFGRYSVSVRVAADRAAPLEVSKPFLGGNRGLGRARNTSVSAVAILEAGPDSMNRLRIYHNPYAAVRLNPAVFHGLPVSQPVLPDAKEIRLWYAGGRRPTTGSTRRPRPSRTLRAQGARRAPPRVSRTLGRRKLRSKRWTALS